MGKMILANDGIDAAGRKILEAAGFTVEADKVAQDALAAAINQNQVIALTVRSATQVRSDLIDACPNLKVIGRGGVGMDNIDVDYARSKGIAVINTPAASSNAVAELVFAHAFNAVRHLCDSNRKMPAVGNTEFDLLKKKYAKGTELRDKTFGIIGFGRIGQAVARMALGLGMKVKASDPFVKEAVIHIDIDGTKGVDVTIKTEPMDDVIAHADLLTVHVPGGKVLGREQLAKMKNGSILINTARGGVIPEVDLLEALDSGRLGYACLDVFENEPTPDPALLLHPRVSLTPHIGASTVEAQERIGVELASKILEALGK